MKGCAGVVVVCVVGEGCVEMCDDTLSLPASHFLALKLSIDKTQKDPNVFSSPMHKLFNLAKHKATVYSWAFDKV